MGLEPVYVMVAFLAGFAAVLLRLPPLLGFLAAGFGLNALGYESTDALQVLANLGVTLLLFSIGLKLNVRVLLEKVVWGTATLQMTATTLFFFALLLVAGKAVALPLLSELDLPRLLLLSFALSFSSTVFVVKMLEDRSESSSFYGRIAIGVLIMQDVFAVLFMAFSSGTLPSPWAALLLLLIPAAPLLQRLLVRVGHGEMQVLFGMALALVLGYGLFEALGVKGDFGALVVGMLLAPHPAASALWRALFNLKELFLVSFFLNLGLIAEPRPALFAVAGVLLLLLPVKSAIYMLVFSRFRMRARSSLLATLSLSNYSEFGLIVGAVAVSQGMLSGDWLTILALVVAGSFVLATPINRISEPVYRRTAQRLMQFQRGDIHPADRPIDAGDAQVVILGMGRIGQGAYGRMHGVFGQRTLGVDNDPKRVRKLQESGFNVIEGDAADSDFWDKLVMSSQVRLIILAMPHHAGNIFALRQLRNRHFPGKIAAVVNYQDEIQPLRLAGADAVFHVYEEAGAGLADHAAETLGLSAASPGGS